MLRQGLAYVGLAPSRWRLATLLQCCQPWLKLSTLARLWSLLYRLKIAYKRIACTCTGLMSTTGLHSLPFNTALLATGPPRQSCFFRMRVPFIPKLARLAIGKPAEKSPVKAQQSFPIAATLDPYSGKVVYLLGNQFTLWAQIAFYQHLVKQYPGCQS